MKLFCCLSFFGQTSSRQAVVVIGICDEHFMLKHKFKLVYFDFTSVQLFLAHGIFPCLKQYTAEQNLT